MSEIGDALEADADAARAEIRKAGIVCPSCRLNMADLPAGHLYAFSAGGMVTALGGHGTVKCQAGSERPMADLDFDSIKAIANIKLLDDFNASFDEQIFGPIRGMSGRITGLLGSPPRP